MSMINKKRVCPTLLAATFLVAICAAPLSAAELSAKPSAQPTCACPKEKTAKAKPVRMHRTRVASPVPRSRPLRVRLASRLFDPAIRFQFPLYLGVAY
jgi:hypothetical protein